MNSTPLSAEELFAFIGGRADASTRQRIAADINVEGTFVYEWFQRLALVCDHPFDIAWERLFDVPLAIPPRVNRREQIGRLVKEAGRLAHNHAYSRAMQLQRWAYNLAAIELGAEDRDTITYLNGLARLQYSAGHFRESLGTYQRALDVRRRVMGDDHTDTAISLAGIGRVYEAIGNFAEAVTVHQQALLICEATFGPNHPDTAVTLNDLGCALQAVGRLDEALRYHERALAINREFDGDVSKNVAIALGNIGCTQESLGRFEEARQNHELSVNTLEAVEGEWHEDTAWALANLGSALLSLRNLNAAEVCFDRCLQILDANNLLQSLEAAFCLNEVGVAQHLSGDHESARQSIAQALHIYGSTWGPHHPATKAAQHNLTQTEQAVHGKVVAGSAQDQLVTLRSLIGDAASTTTIEKGLAAWSVPVEGRSLVMSLVLAA